MRAVWNNVDKRKISGMDFLSLLSQNCKISFRLGSSRDDNQLVIGTIGAETPGPVMVDVVLVVVFGPPPRGVGGTDLRR